MLVWNAMLSITPMISAICLLDFVMVSIVLMTSLTALPPVSAVVHAAAAIWLACRAASELLRTVAFICSIDAAVCCRLLAWFSVRADRSLVPVAISCFLAGVTWWLAGGYAGAQPVLIVAALILGGLVYVASLLLLAGAQVSRYIGVIAETTAKNQPTLVRILNWLSSTTTSLDMVARMRTRAGGVQFR